MSDEERVQHEQSCQESDIVFLLRVDPRQLPPPQPLTRAKLARRLSSQVEYAIKNGSEVMRPFVTLDGVRFEP